VSISHTFKPGQSQSVGFNYPMPIIVGVARSGTTLLRLMLDAHSQLAITHEAGFIPMASNLTNPLSRMFYRRLKNTVKHKSRLKSLREAFFRTLTEEFTWNDFHVDKEAFAGALLQLQPFSITEGFRTFFRMYAMRFDKPRWGDKTPFYCQYLPVVQNVLPEAHFIHIIRDGRDVAVSGRGLRFTSGSIEGIARDWVRQIRLARKDARACPRYLEIRYEDLLLKSAELLREICEFINLPYESRMEQYYLRANERLDELRTLYRPDGAVFATMESRLHLHRLTSRPPEPTRIGRWKTELTREELSTFNGIAGKLLKELGYEK
jgi:sulfotransferase family protein